MRRLSVSVSDQLLASVERLAAENRWSVSSTCVWLLERGLGGKVTVVEQPFKPVVSVDSQPRDVSAREVPVVKVEDDRPAWQKRLDENARGK